MTRHGSPVTIRWGSRDPAAPLIVLFHGRDANETDMAWLRIQRAQRAYRHPNSPAEPAQ